MKNYILSVIVLAISTFFIFTENLNQLFSNTQTERFLANPHESSANMKAQQAHLRTIDPFDIDVMPTSRPIPDRFPLGSVFGMRKHPILKVDRMHKGIDFGAPAGTPVLATATGRISRATFKSDSSSYGKHIIIEHDEEYSSLYAHLSGLVVKQGQIVEEGDTIGFVGSTGMSTNPHLHYEVIFDGRRVDPENYLQ
ncbi:MAG: M23 family metallopeptidase [Bacteroidota bacterium]